jgi:exosortase J
MATLSNSATHPHSSESLSASTSEIAETLPAAHPKNPELHHLFFWSILALLAVIGSLGLSQHIISLWTIWTTDPLRSIGILIAPAAVVLFLREWRNYKWQLRGTWWGVAPLTLAFVPIIFSRDLVLSFGSGEGTVNVIPHVLPIYLYASGIVLLFAGVRIWKKAWFSLALLLCLQPVPAFVVNLFDLPLQGLAAHIARSFAALIGFPPTSTELLRLMFTPDFGMFIAPGCDGMRGAVTLGYVALIAGYLKRASLMRWFLYVTGAVLLGHIFNLIRLCALVVYYRIAVGHPNLESVAKQADYVIGGCLYALAALLFMWLVLRKEHEESAADAASQSEIRFATPNQKLLYLKMLTFATLAVIAAIPGVEAILLNRESLAVSIRSGELSSQELDDRMPKQFGDYLRARSWQEQEGESTVMENAAYIKGTSGEISLGIWLRPTWHSVHQSWMTHGDSPQLRANRTFMTFGGQSVPFDTAFYSDGITDIFAGNTYCSPAYCVASFEGKSGIRLRFAKSADFTTRGARLVPIYFRVEQPHTSALQEITNKELLDKSQNFLANINLTELSGRFQ